MAKYNYEEYAANKPATSGSGNLPKTHFMGEYLKNDGDFAIVRFPYTSMKDVIIESGHKVMGVFPNNKFGKFVTCTGDDTCPLCRAEDEDTRKIINMCYVKAVVYTQENGKVVLNPTVWERKAAFADNDLKSLITNYGNLRNYLFKITRTGSGTATRYNILPVLNKDVYPDSAYVADFSSIENVDPVKILAKSTQQYLEALNPGSTTKSETTTTVPVKEEVKSQPETIAYTPDCDPFVKPTEPVVNVAPTTPTTVTPEVRVETPATESVGTQTRTKKYTF